MNKVASKITAEDLLKTAPILRVGQIVDGRVLEVGKNAVFIDLGPYKIGVLLGREIKENREIIKNWKPGETISVMVVDPENDDGYVELSLREAYFKKNWEILKTFKETDATIKVKVIQANRGGLIIEIRSVRGFMPTSQLSAQNFPYVEGADPVKIVNQLNKLVGQELEVKIIDLNQHEEKLIVSEKAIEEFKIRDILSDYRIGELVEGEVSRLADFGAFIKIPLKKELKKDNVNIGAVNGLIYISELDWQLVKDPREILKVGDKIKAKVINLESDKLILSLKALKPDPWQDIEKKYKKGDVIKAKVIKFNPFGAFLEVEKSILGLIHISEFGSVEKMKESLELDKKYNFEIISLDSREHKMSLTLETKS